MWVALLSTFPVLAQEPYDTLWSYVDLYENPDADAIQSFSFTGRAQVEYVFFDADDAGEFEDLLWRRFRFGFKSKFADDWLIHLEGDFDLNSDVDSDYQNLTDAYLAWQLNPDWEAKFLKQSAGFTLDGMTSSKRLITPERNNLTNNLWFTAEYFSGVTLAGPCTGNLGCKAGVFSSDEDDQLLRFDAGYFGLLLVDYELGEQLGQDRFTLTGAYVYNDGDELANTPQFGDVLSFTSQWEQGPWGIWADAAFGWGYDDQSDVAGFVAMPFYNVSPHWQLVLRYTWLRSDDDGGVRFGRYERELVDVRGDRYREVFAGLNWYLYGHKLKWQTGLQKTRMDDATDSGGDYDGWGLTTGLRLSW